MSRDLSKGKQKQVHDRDGHKCRYCGEPSECVDHIVPKSKGGSSEMDNLAAACNSCNMKKGSTLPENLSEDWYQKTKRTGRNFAPMPLAVLASEAPPRAKLLILALFHHDWEGQRAWPSQDRLARIMSCSRDTVGEALKDCVAQGWIITRRRFADSSIYEINVPDMSFEQFEAKIKGIRLRGIPATANPDTTEKESLQLLQDIPTLTEIKEAEPNKAEPPKASKAAKHPDQDSFWAEAKRFWENRFGGQALAWVKDDRNFQGKLTEAINNYGWQELAKRFGHCVNDPWSRPSLREFIRDPDKWITPRTSDVKPGAKKMFHPNFEM